MSANRGNFESSCERTRIRKSGVNEHCQKQNYAHTWIRTNDSRGNRAYSIPLQWPPSRAWEHLYPAKSTEIYSQCFGSKQKIEYYTRQTNLQPTSELLLDRVFIVLFQTQFLLDNFQLFREYVLPMLLFHLLFDLATDLLLQFTQFVFFLQQSQC